MYSNSNKENAALGTTPTELASQLPCEIRIDFGFKAFLFGNRIY